MKYFRHEVKVKEVTLYPLVCWHVGAAQSDTKFILNTIERIKDDPTARWVYMGDGGECATKFSKGDVYTQTLNPQEQLNELHDLLRPIREKGLFMIRGNHGHRTQKESGLEFDESLALALQLPYLGVAALWQMVLGETPFDIYTHHGSDSGVGIASKINAAKKAEAIVGPVDAIFTAHSHIAMDLPPKYSAVIDSHARSAGGDPIKYVATHEYIAGSAYDSRSGYAEEKMYPAIIASHISVKFGVHKGHRGIREKSQEFKVWRASV